MERLRTDPCRQAALAYFLYGVIYLLGAGLEARTLSPEQVARYSRHAPLWTFFAVGALVVLALPVFIDRGVRWLTLALALMVSVKAGTLFWTQGRALASADSSPSFFKVFFAVVALLAALALARAGLRRR